jgi:hypothetical protein
MAERLCIGSPIRLVVKCAVIHRRLVSGLPRFCHTRWYLIRRRSLNEEHLEYRARKRSPGKKGCGEEDAVITKKSCQTIGCVSSPCD